jgi:LytTr DNA-binding domain
VGFAFALSSAKIVRMTASQSTKSIPDFPVSPVLRALAMACLCGVILGVLGPFGSYLNGGVLIRTMYWLAAILLGLLFYGTAIMAVKRIASPDAWFRWPLLFGAAFVASAPEALVTRAAALWLWPELAGVGPNLTLWYGQTLVVGLIGTAAGTLLIQHPAASRHDEQSLPPHSPLPAEALKGEILALQMEDHYVRVHGPTGSELILMPLGHAISCVQAQGLRTHRSWWVARDAVIAVEGSARAMSLRLSNGLVAPVARSAVIHLKAAGWIDG